MSCNQWLMKKLFIGFPGTTVTIHSGSTGLDTVMENASHVEARVYTWYSSGVIRQFFYDQLDEISGDTFVGIEILEDLLRKCMVIEDHPELASEELPADPDWNIPEDGIYGADYMQEIRETKEMLLAEKQSGSFEIFDYYFDTEW